MARPLTRVTGSARRYPNMTSEEKLDLDPTFKKITGSGSKIQEKTGSGFDLKENNQTGFEIKKIAGSGSDL